MVIRIEPNSRLHALLHEYFSYNQRTGLLTWNRKSGKRVKIGDEAGHIHAYGNRQAVYVTFRGRVWLAHRLIWHYVTGAPPKGDITAQNGDLTDLRWSNLIEREKTRSNNPANIRKRQLRRSYAEAHRTPEDPTA